LKVEIAAIQTGFTNVGVIDLAPIIFACGNLALESIYG
jgi:hypothetical protein